jgi:hypothetical protein
MVQLLRHNSKKRHLCRVINSVYYHGRSQAEKAGNILIMQSKGREEISSNGVKCYFNINLRQTFSGPPADKQEHTSTTPTM